MVRRALRYLGRVVAISVVSSTPLFGESARCARIVSLAPSVTETLSAVGLGERIVGVSRYDRSSPVVAGLPRVGGLFDPHFEAIVALRPTLVVALTEFGDKVSYARDLGLTLEVADHRSIRGILESMIKLGELCGTEVVAREQVRSLTARMEGVRRHAEGARPIRTLVVVGGGSEGALLRSVYVSGRDGFYDDIVRIAGGENVVTTRTMSVPTLSAEGLMALDPEVIIQVRDEVESRGTSPEEIKAAWGRLGYLQAVRRGRVYILSDDYVTVPGPRFVETLESFAAILNQVRDGITP